MSERLERTLLQVTEQTCEALAFMFPVPAPDAPGIDDGEIARVQVRFSGPCDGSLALTIPREILPSLAGNMLGLDPAATDARQREDAAKELCNVVCGNLLPAIAGPEPVFSVSAPRLRAPEQIERQEGVSVRTWLSEGWIEAHLSLEAGLDWAVAYEETG